MPKKKAVTPNMLLKAWVSPELKAKLYLHLASEVEGRIPLGKISEFLAERIREHFEWEELDMSAYGLPAGYFVRGPRPMVQALRDKLVQQNKLTLKEGQGGLNAIA